MCSGSPRHQSFDGSAKMALKLYLIRLSADVRNEIVLVVTSSLTSIPTCRKTLRAEKFDRYFDFKHLKICAHLNISYKFL